MSSIPNVCESSGVSRDYLLTFGSLDNYLRRIQKEEPPRLRLLAKRAFLHREIKKYADVFCHIPAVELLTEGNKTVVQQLDALVDRLNAMRKEGKANYEELLVIWKEIKELILSGAIKEVRTSGEALSS